MAMTTLHPFIQLPSGHEGVREADQEDTPPPGLSVEGLVGIGVGAALALLLLIIIVWRLCRMQRCRRRESSDARPATGPQMPSFRLLTLGNHYPGHKALLSVKKLPPNSSRKVSSWLPHSSHHAASSCPEKLNCQLADVVPQRKWARPLSSHSLDDKLYVAGGQSSSQQRLSTYLDVSTGPPAPTSDSTRSSHGSHCLSMNELLKQMSSTSRHQSGGSPEIIMVKTPQSSKSESHLSRISNEEDEDDDYVDVSELGRKMFRPLLPPKARPFLPPKQRINQSLDALAASASMMAQCPESGGGRQRPASMSGGCSSAMATPYCATDYDEPAAGHDHLEDYDEPVHHHRFLSSMLNPSS